MKEELTTAMHAELIGEEISQRDMNILSVYGGLKQGKDMDALLRQYGVTEKEYRETIGELLGEVIPQNVIEFAKENGGYDVITVCGEYKSQIAYRLRRSTMQKGRKYGLPIIVGLTKDRKPYFVPDEDVISNSQFWR